MCYRIVTKQSLMQDNIFASHTLFIYTWDVTSYTKKPLEMSFMT